MDALRYQGLYMTVAVWASPASQAQNKHDSRAFRALPAQRDHIEKLPGLQLPVLQGLPELTSVAGKLIGIESMVTSQIHVSDNVTKGLDELVKHKDNHIEIMVTPDVANV
jgi:hypothetical protein